MKYFTVLTTTDVSEVNIVQIVAYTSRITNLLGLKRFYNYNDKFVMREINFYVLIIQKTITLMTKHIITTKTIDVKAINFVKMI